MIAADIKLFPGRQIELNILKGRHFFTQAKVVLS